MTELTLGLSLILIVYPVGWYIASLLVSRSTAVAAELRVDASRRQLTIDGLRGVLAVAVFCHHIVLTRNFLHSGSWQMPDTPFANELGQASVALFFMITSFLFWGRLLDAGPKMKWDYFFISRFFRLVPLYLVMVGVIVFVTFVRTRGHLLDTPLGLLKRVTHWVAFTMASAPDVNHLSRTSLVVAGVTWSLRYEWVFYFALPACGLIFTRARSPIVALGSTAALLLALRISRWDPILFERVCPFLGGIVAAYWIRSEKWRRVGGSLPFGLLALAGATWVTFFRLEPYAPLPLVLMSLFFVAIACDNRIFAFLCNAPARWLGEVSYGIYLLHGVFIWVGTRWVVPRLFKVTEPSDTALVAFAVTAIPMIVVITTALNLWIERPGISLGRRFTALRFLPSSRRSRVIVSADGSALS